MGSKLNLDMLRQVARQMARKAPVYEGNGYILFCRPRTFGYFRKVRTKVGPRRIKHIWVSDLKK